MSKVKFFEKFQFSEEIEKYKNDFLKKNGIDENHKIITNQSFRNEYISETVNPKLISCLFEYISSFQNIVCCKESILDISKFIIEKCLRSQDALELSDAPGEIILKAAKEFDGIFVDQILRFLYMKDIHEPRSLEKVQEKILMDKEQEVKRIDISNV